jgi:hypothetical protein
MPILDLPQGFFGVQQKVGAIGQQVQKNSNLGLPGGIPVNMGAVGSFISSQLKSEIKQQYTPKPENLKRAQNEDSGYNGTVVKIPILLIDTISGETLELQYVPELLEITPVYNFQEIKTAGRNLPLYHYNGGDYYLDFEIDWSAAEENREDVIRKCRWVESLSFNNGFKGSINPVILSFGNLFKNRTWIVTEAPYKTSLFHGSRNLLPTQAYQKVKLKLISDTNPEKDFFKSVSDFTPIENTL